MKIAFLATGNELTTGDILNTNAQIMARALFDHGFELGNHLLVADEQDKIATGLQYLLTEQDIIIVTGGLGPTSDDRTRFAIAESLGKELVFDESSWDQIVARLKGYNFPINPSNKQQALFCEGATVLENPNGTANGCYITFENKLIFMLPGPPRECLPLFHNRVLPLLQKKQIKPIQKHFKWRLFGVSEGEIAARLDKLVSTYPCTTGYRWDYPYLEFKLLFDADDVAASFDEVSALIEETIAPHVICQAEKSALTMFSELLNKTDRHIIINDQATCGLLQYKLSESALKDKITFINEPSSDFNPEKNESYYFFIAGLEELQLHQQQQVNYTNIVITAHHHNKTITKKRTIPFRNRRVIDFAVEYSSYVMRQILEEE